VARARFGTDGVRGVANVDLTPEFVLSLGRAVARTIAATEFIVGRDTRRSGPLLQAAFSAGVASEGADVIDVGELPTPGVAWLSAERGVPAVVVSASHNPFADNGIKVFAAGGLKLSEAIEAAIEAELERVQDAQVRGPRQLEGHGVGRLHQEHGLGEAYVGHLGSLTEGRRLDGLRLVVDSAHGAASALAASVYRQLGAEVIAIGCEPDGTNINDGVGSTSTGALSAAVVESGADLGLALDGDADRLLAVDATGQQANGDQLLALFALDLAQRGQLAGHAVVVTVMTNLGFRLAMEEHGILVKETPVGDRHVLAAIDEGGYSLGGEQSGHIIFRRMATTGDGLLTGLVLADLIHRRGESFAAMLDGLVTPVPQVLVNVPVPDTELLADATAVWSAVAEEQERLGETGRVVLRPSGTEPVVRVMVEAVGDGVAAAVAERLSALVGFELQAAAAVAAAAADAAAAAAAANGG
jgi:phosphoglucosamine mutase